VGSLDAQHSVVEIQSNQIRCLNKWQIHSKHVVRVKWNPVVDAFATASYDHSVSYFTATDTSDCYVLQKKFTFSASPEAIEFTSVLIQFSTNYSWYVFSQYITELLLV
jgi:WD40 repeat protein